jgi:hypothetical protein
MSVKKVQFSINGQTYDLTYDAGSQQYKATITAPSTTSYNENEEHKFYGTVTAEDNAGNRVTATKDEFEELKLRVLEKEKPVIAVTYPTAGAYITSAAPVFKWNVTDTGSGIDTSSISIKIDGNTAVTSGIETSSISNGYACTYTPSEALGEGSHTVYFNVSDHDGNTATQASVTFTVDTIPPTLVITSPADGLVTNQSSILVSGNTNDATSSPVTVKVQVNGGIAQSAEVAPDGAFLINVTLAEGSNTIRVVATDSAGKSTTVERSVVLDTGAPVITAITLTPNPVDAGATYIVSVTVTDS